MIELISIHIPKTAGRTFGKLLGKQYGKRHVLLLNRGLLGKERIREEIRGHINDQTRVIHGHFHYRDISALHREGTRLITWLREPVARIVSNYNYNSMVERPSRGKEVLSFDEFIRHPKRRNLMSRFLEGVKLEQLDFIGLQESFEADLQRLANMLDWDEITTFKSVNRTLHPLLRPSDLSPDQLAAIREFHAEDVALYESARKLRSA